MLYIRSYIPYLEAAASIRNVRTRHAVTAEDHLSSHSNSLPLNI
jgi:hypothetical protein